MVLWVAYHWTIDLSASYCRTGRRDRRVMFGIEKLSVIVAKEGSWAVRRCRCHSSVA